MNQTNFPVVTTTEEQSGGNRLTLLSRKELSGEGKQMHDMVKQMQTGRYDPKYSSRSFSF